MPDGKIRIEGVKLFDAASKKTKRVLEYTVDWALGGEVETVLRTLDRKAAQRLFDKLHHYALRLNKLGVTVCVELTSESKVLDA